MIASGTAKAMAAVFLHAWAMGARDAGEALREMADRCKEVMAHLLQRFPAYLLQSKRTDALLQLFAGGPQHRRGRRVGIQEAQNGVPDGGPACSAAAKANDNCQLCLTGVIGAAKWHLLDSCATYHRPSSISPQSNCRPCAAQFVTQCIYYAVCLEYDCCCQWADSCTFHKRRPAKAVALHCWSR